MATKHEATFFEEEEMERGRKTQRWGKNWVPWAESSHTLAAVAPTLELPPRFILYI